jgi:iron complex outermembrane receptor protein
VRVTPLESLDVTLSGFATRIARESIYDHVSGINLELNGTRRVGAELVLRARPATGSRSAPT